MATPYLSVAMLNAASTGIPWNLIPDINANDLARLAEQTNILSRATSVVDTYCRQKLRAVLSNEELSGPGLPRFGYLAGTDIPQLCMRRWPVTEVLAIQLSPMRAFPRQWRLLEASKYEIEFPLMDLLSPGSSTAPDGGFSILLEADTVPQAATRRGSLRAMVSYLNGWPHTSLTAPASAGDTVLQVDDVTSWQGVAGVAYDGASEEDVWAVSATAAVPFELPNGVGTAQTGPGSITLASPLGYNHDVGVVVSALPASAQLATIYACVLQALDSGTESITAEVLSGSVTSSGSANAWIAAEFMRLLADFRRVV